MPDSIPPHPGNSSWISSYVGMTCRGSTAQLAIIFESGYTSRDAGHANPALSVGPSSVARLDLLQDLTVKILHKMNGSMPKQRGINRCR